MSRLTMGLRPSYLDLYFQFSTIDKGFCSLLTYYLHYEEALTLK